MSRWQLGVAETDRDPLSPWFGEPAAYEVVAPERGALTLHPSRVIRFLGNPLPDPGLFGAEAWSDSVLSTLYDAIHAVALTTTGATSLMHEAKVDVVTVPNLSEHLSNAATTAQLSARFSYAATMKSINSLLLLGDGESWTRQKIDFAGLPEMVRTFLQVAAGAADIPVTRLLGQSPAGLSATGDSDTRNYYDMIAARQEIDLRPQLERLDRFLLASAGVAPGTLRFAFRPLWQMDAAAKAAMALQKAQATQIYAGLGLWPAEVMAGLVRGQLAEDGVYPGGDGMFSGERQDGPASTNGQAFADFGFDPNQARDPQGRWTEGGGSSNASRAPNETSSGPTLGQILSGLNRAGTGQAHEPNLEKEREGSSSAVSSDPDLQAANSTANRVRLAQATTGPLLPGGVMQVPIQGIDPLDPTSLNLSPPSAHEQLALANTLNLIQSGAILGLNPHTYNNRPDPKTGAILPPSSGGYTTYDVPMGGPNRGTRRVILDNATRMLYYTNTHYRSFFPIILSKTP